MKYRQTLQFIDFIGEISYNNNKSRFNEVDYERLKRADFDYLTATGDEHKANPIFSSKNNYKLDDSILKESYRLVSIYELWREKEMKEHSEIRSAEEPDLTCSSEFNNSKHSCSDSALFGVYGSKDIPSGTHLDERESSIQASEIENGVVPSVDSGRNFIVESKKNSNNGITGSFHEKTCDLGTKSKPGIGSADHLESEREGAGYSLGKFLNEVQLWEPVREPRSTGYYIVSIKTLLSIARAYLFIGDLNGIIIVYLVAIKSKLLQNINSLNSENSDTNYMSHLDKHDFISDISSNKETSIVGSRVVPGNNTEYYSDSAGEFAIDNPEISHNYNSENHYFDDSGLDHSFKIIDDLILHYVELGKLRNDLLINKHAKCEQDLTDHLNLMDPIIEKQVIEKVWEWVKI
ncbi:hypothetical protein AYI69_g4507 [Smittium culicis]|uniref:Uncharacterized protein n=1 Tax=Smittium culicis TaxID=133412 RepID=A0A1R1YD36_9FUNG|nr:hypothetical protein AYI69_g4507 [Smittium culicis]